MRKPSMRQAEWIAKKMSANADDVFDVLLGNITSPSYFVDEVNYEAVQYELALAEGNKHVKN